MHVVAARHATTAMSRDGRAFHRELVQRVSAIPGLDAVGAEQRAAARRDGQRIGSALRRPAAADARRTKREPTSLFQAITPGLLPRDGHSDRARPRVHRSRHRRHGASRRHRGGARPQVLSRTPIRSASASRSSSSARTTPPRSRSGARSSASSSTCATTALSASRANFQVYAPLEQLPLWFRERRPTMTLFARTALAPRQRDRGRAPGGVAASIRTIPVFGLQTMEEYVDASDRAVAPEHDAAGAVRRRSRSSCRASASTACCRYSVGRRTQEIGIRLALGATRGDVMRLIVGHGMALTPPGIAIGLAASWAMTRIDVGRCCSASRRTIRRPSSRIRRAARGRSPSGAAICPAAAPRASIL